MMAKTPLRTQARLTTPMPSPEVSANSRINPLHLVTAGYLCCRSCNCRAKPFGTLPSRRPPPRAEVAMPRCGLELFNADADWPSRPDGCSAVFPVRHQEYARSGITCGAGPPRVLAPLPLALGAERGALNPKQPRAPLLILRSTPRYAAAGRRPPLAPIESRGVGAPGRSVSVMTNISPVRSYWPYRTPLVY
jgi:hypothetical protein